MKTIPLWIYLLFISVDVYANDFYIVTEQWKLSTEREQCIEFDVDGNCTKYDPLSLDKIAYHTMYRVDCDTKQKTGKTINYKIDHDLTILFWRSPTLIDCVVMTTTDTDGRTSKDSEIFYGVQYGTPKPVECKP